MYFICWGRFGRLVYVVIVNLGCIGIGLGEDMVLVVCKGCEVECFGLGMVVIIDGCGIMCINVVVVFDDILIYVENMKVYFVVKECFFDLVDCVFVWV